MSSLLIRIITVFFFLLVTANAYSWGSEGHSVVGSLAMQQLNEQAKSELEKILGSINKGQMADACNWADKVRPTPQWEHTYPMLIIARIATSDEEPRSPVASPGGKSSGQDEMPQAPPSGRDGPGDFVLTY